MNVCRAAVLIFLFAVAASFADETNALPAKITIDGVAYQDVRWGATTPYSVTITHKGGVARIPLNKLPPELQARFHYDVQKAAAYRKAESAAEAQARIVAAGRDRQYRARKEAEAGKMAEEDELKVRTKTAIPLEVKDLKNFPERYLDKIVQCECNISGFKKIEYGNFQGNFGIDAEGVEIRGTSGMELLNGENPRLLRHGDGIYLWDFFIVRRERTPITSYCHAAMDGNHSYFANVYVKVGKDEDGHYYGSVFRIEFTYDTGKTYKIVESMD